MEWLKVILSNAAAIATIIALIAKLVDYAQKIVKEKNWREALRVALSYMGTAEQMFDNGADRKEWVLSMLEASSTTINFDFDRDKASKLIDDLCQMSKQVNVEMKAGG